MNEAKQLQSREHLPALDGLRGIAILLVLFYHFTILIPQGPAEEFFKRISELGTYGVDLFFVLSGFLVTRILLREKGKPAYFKNFYMRRILRIFPLYYLIVAFSFLALPLLLSLRPGFNIHENPHDWAWFVFFASNFLVALKGQFTHDILGVSWSLAIEEQFYVVWPWGIAQWGPRILKRLLFGIIGGALLLRWLLWTAGLTTTQVYVLTFTRMDSLAFGALLALQAREWQAETAARRTKQAAVLTGATAGLLFFTFALNWFDVRSTPMNTFMYTLVAFFFAQLLTLVLLAKDGSWIWRIFSQGFLRLMGKYSYALYLMHVPVRSLIRNAGFDDAFFRHLPGGVFAGQLLFYFTALAGCLILAHFSWNFYEKKFLALKSRFA